MADKGEVVSLWDVAKWLSDNDLVIVGIEVIDGKFHAYTQKKMVLGDSPTPSEEGDTTAHVKGNDNG